MFSGKLLRSIAKPTRYTGGEYNAVQPKPDAAVSMLLVFPDLYEIGMSSLGLKVIYHFINEHPDFWCDLAFSPWPDAEAVMRHEGIPLYGLIGRRPAREYDIIGFSMGHEFCYTNVLNAIDLAGLPVLSAERGDRDPVVIAGGNCASNPAPMADFIDAFYVGEAEARAYDIMRCVADYRDKGRTAIITALAEVPGIYAPSIHDCRVSDTRHPTPDTRPPADRQYVRDYADSYYPTRQIVPLQQVEHDRVSLEIMRGCPNACRFCQASVCYRPARYRSAERILELAEQSIRETGCDEISLVSLSSTDHPEIEEIARGLMDRFASRRVALALPSIRANPRWVRLAAEIQRVRKTGLTLAPEAGSQRLRDTLAKNVDDDEIYKAASEAFANGWERLKLYFMIGLPGETEEDVRAIGEMANRIHRLGREKGKKGDLNVSVTTFVPKPGTPWERAGQDPRDAITEKHKILIDSLRGKAIRLSWHDPRSSQLEASFALGDRSVGRAILEAWKQGAKFDGWDEYLNHDRWHAAFESAGLTMEQFANRGFTPEESLPWSMVKQLPGQGIEIAGLVKPEEARGYPKPSRRLIAGAGLSHLLMFTKGDEVRWSSHLDMARAFDRAARRAGLPIMHTQGFNPRPKITFDGALPVGVTSECERVHILLSEPVSSPDLVEMLNAELPVGFSITEASDITGSRGDLMTKQESRGYELRFLFVEEQRGSVAQAIAAILARAEVIVSRTKGNQTKQVDIRPGIRSLDLVTENGTEASVRTVFAWDTPNSPKIGELADLFTSELPAITDWSAHRIA